jgi:hypothetical protein
MSCACCGADSAPHKCGACHAAYYCDAKCQSDHLTEHECIDKHNDEAIKSAIERHLDDLPIEDEIDEDFAAVGEALLSDFDRSDTEMVDMALDWISIGALFKTNKGKAARGQRKQAKGLRQERRAQGRLNPKRLVLRAKESKMRGRSAMSKKTAKKKGLFYKKKTRK